MTSVSNAYEMVVKGQNVIRMPFATVDDFRARPGLNGIPLLAPFANRLDEQAFYANGKKYNFDMELGNVRGAIPIHGFLSAARRTGSWSRRRPTATSAWVTSRLDFYRNPQWMKQFPFAHTLEMTYRLADGVLEVQDADRESQRRADAGGDRVSSVLPVDRLDARGLGALDRREDALAAGGQQDSDRRNGTRRQVLPRSQGGRR